MTQIALITGASRGLGFALAQALAPTYHIVAVARTVGGLEDLDDRIKEKGGEATLAPMDITNRDAMAHLCRSIYDRWGPGSQSGTGPGSQSGTGPVALWAHTAIHAAPLTPVPHMDQKDWQKSLSINVDALAHMIPFVAPLLGSAGQALFFDDPHGGEPYFGHYGATKAAQIALARSWQAETAKIGPQVHVMQPRPLATATRARFYPGEDRSPLATPADEATRLLATLSL